MAALLTGTARAWFRRRPVVADGVLALGFCAVDLLLSADLAAPDSPPAWLVVGYAVLGYAALAFRRRAPVTVLAVLVLHFAVAVTLMPVYRPTFAVLLGLYTVAAHRDLRASLVGLVGVFAVTATGLSVAQLGQVLAPGQTPAGVVQTMVLIQAILATAAWAGGRWARATRRSAAYQQELEAVRRADALRAERVGIARDLHDIVSQAVSAMVIHTGVARAVVHADPDRAARSLDEVETAGATAMDELAEMLALLRADQDPQRRSLASLADLEPVLAPSRTVGVDVAQEVHGVARPLDAATELTAVRVVQESLANTVKHAGPGTRAVVTVLWDDDVVTVEVCDDGRGRPTVPAPRGGHGLRGLRERVAAGGGSLHAGPRPGGGFAVRAELPVRSTELTRVA